MKHIPLTQGKYALVDDDDYEWLSQWKWFYGNGYAVRNMTTSSGQTRLYMHREILGTPGSNHTDHINADRLDNRKTNLRSCTQLQNNRNRGKSITNTSGYKGVSYHKATGKWRATIRDGNRYIHLGLFDDKISAAETYDKAVLIYHGDFANLNAGGKE